MYQIVEVWHSSKSDDCSSVSINMVLMEIKTSLYMQRYWKTLSQYESNSPSVKENQYFERRLRSQRRLLYELLLEGYPVDENTIHPENGTATWVSTLEEAL